MVVSTIINVRVGFQPICVEGWTSRVLMWLLVLIQVWYLVAYSAVRLVCVEKCKDSYSSYQYSLCYIQM